jgi:hypothetical protein
MRTSYRRYWFAGNKKIPPQRDGAEIRSGGSGLPGESSQIEAIQLHHFAPRTGEIAYEFRCVILLRIHFCNRTQLGI